MAGTTMRRYALHGLLLVLAIGLGLFFSLGPWKLYAEQKQRANASEAEMREVQGERAELTRERSYAESPVGREELARGMGFKKPGERPVEIR